MPTLPNEIFQQIVQYAGLVDEIKKRRKKYLMYARALTWDRKLAAVFTVDFKKYLCEYELLQRAYDTFNLDFLNDPNWWGDEWSVSDDAEIE